MSSNCDLEERLVEIPEHQQPQRPQQSPQQGIFQRVIWKMGNRSFRVADLLSLGILLVCTVILLGCGLGIFLPAMRWRDCDYQMASCKVVEYMIEAGSSCPCDIYITSQDYESNLPVTRLYKDATAEEQALWTDPTNSEAVPCYKMNWRINEWRGVDFELRLLSQDDCPYGGWHAKLALAAMVIAAFVFIATSAAWICRACS